MNIAVRQTSEDYLVENLVGAGAAQILKLAANPIFICDNEHILYVNPQGYKLFGFENPSNVISRPISDFVADDFADIILLGLDAFADETEGIPLKMMDMSGQIHDVKMQVSHLINNEENKQDGASLYLVECKDITEFLEASQSARMREERIKSILQSVNEAIVTIDELGMIKDMNESACRMFGWQKPVALGKPVTILMPEPYKSEHHQYMVNYLLTGKSAMLNKTRELTGERKNGETFPLEMALSTVKERHGRQIFTGIMRDISERKKQEEHLNFIAYHDALTGLPNRAMFQERIERASARSDRHKHSFGLIFIDLDNFKPINDTLGHDAGDQVLIEVSQRFQKMVRTSDTVVRLGGDEFVAIVEDLQDSQDAELIAQKILDCLQKPINIQGEDHQVGASLGIALYPEHATDLEQLIEAADSAMYEAKKAGRNQYCSFESTS